MFTKEIKVQVVKLQKELQDNKGIVPDAWLPYINIFKLLLNIAKFFTPDDVDVIINEILQAIDLIENS